MSWEVLTGDCVEQMREMDEASVDAIVTDPPYGLEFMGKEWDRLISKRPSYNERSANHTEGGRHGGGSDPFIQARVEEYVGGKRAQEWHQAWATEALRVLKPGGHLLAFGGTRTYHRLACAVEDAGFEIRDSVIWLYGSGFPKSLDVSKAIDKAAGAEREDLGPNPNRDGRTQDIRGGSLHASADSKVEDVGDLSRLTAPATPEAAQWEGWGTALKPSHEIVVVGQKPDAGDDAKIAASLCLLGEQLSSLASDAASDSESKPVEHVEAMFASAGWTADERRSTRDALCEAMGTSRFESALASSLNIVSSWSATLDALCELTSTFTTETDSGTTTALRTLRSSVSDLTPRTIIQAATNPDGSGLSALPAARAFSAVESRLRLTRELLAPAPATSESRDSSPVAADSPPAHEPIVVARKPLVGTVAANVLEHGTGALNIAATRIGSEATERKRTDNDFGLVNDDGWEPTPGVNGSPSGRWPANVTLSPEAAAALDKQSGERTSGGGNKNTANRDNGQTIGHGLGAGSGDGIGGDSGGASRFFLTVQPDMLCALCNLPLVESAGNPSSQSTASSDIAPSVVQDERPPEREDKSGESREPAQPAESSGKTTPGTSASTAPSDASPPDSERSALPASGAVNLCASCETAIAQSDAATSRSQEDSDSREESTHGQPSIRQHNEQTPTPNPAPIAGTQENTDTMSNTTIPQSSSGSVRGAIPLDTLSGSEASGRDQTRFRYSSKASRGERNAGLDGFEEQVVWRTTSEGLGLRREPGQLSSTDEPTQRRPARNGHPTVKPIDLMRWLVRLVTPPGGTVLDPFTGSGTTGIAAVLEGFDFIGIEREAEYCEIARARIAWWEDKGGDTKEILKATKKAEAKRKDQLEL